MDDNGWSMYGAERSQPVAISRKWEGAENASIGRKPLPYVATSCRDMVRRGRRFESVRGLHEVAALQLLFVASGMTVGRPGVHLTSTARRDRFLRWQGITTRLARAIGRRHTARPASRNGDTSSPEPPGSETSSRRRPSAFENGQVELAEPFGVGEDVDLDDPPAADSEGRNGERFSVTDCDGSDGAVDECRPHE